MGREWDSPISVEFEAKCGHTPYKFDNSHNMSREDDETDKEKEIAREASE